MFKDLDPHSIVVTKHNRREGCRPYCEPAKGQERTHRETPVQVIRENPCPRPKGSGRPPEHSKEKMDFIRLWMIPNNDAFRNAEGAMHDLKMPWEDAPIPAHAIICRHLSEMPGEWIDLILAETARRCMKASGEAIGPPGADSR